MRRIDYYYLIKIRRVTILSCTLYTDINNQTIKTKDFMVVMNNER